MTHTLTINFDGETVVEVDVSSRAVALEIGHAVSGRAADIHDNPHDDFEHIARQLRDAGREIREEFRDAAEAFTDSVSLEEEVEALRPDDGDDIEADTDMGRLFRGEFEFDDGDDE